MLVLSLLLWSFVPLLAVAISVDVLTEPSCKPAEFIMLVVTYDGSSDCALTTGSVS